MTSVTSTMWESDGAAVLLDGEFHDGVRAIVEHPLEALQLPLRIGADPIGDLEVLALDDGPHTLTSRGRAPSLRRVCWGRLRRIGRRPAALRVYTRPPPGAPGRPVRTVCSQVSGALPGCADDRPRRRSGRGLSISPCRPVVRAAARKGRRSAPRACPPSTRDWSFRRGSPSGCPRTCRRRSSSWSGAPVNGLIGTRLHELKYAGEKRLAVPLGAAIARRWRRAGAAATSSSRSPFTPTERGRAATTRPS